MAATNPFADPEPFTDSESISDTAAINTTEPPISDSSSLPPVLFPDYTRPNKTGLTIHCHDHTFKSVSIYENECDTTSTTTTQKTPLFTVTSKGSTSLTWRRTITSHNGTKLFDLRHMGYTLKNDWSVENPCGQRICSLKHVKQFSKNRYEIDALIHTDGAEDVVMEIRPKDVSAITLMVRCRGREVAVIRNTQANHVSGLEKKGLDRTVWEVSVLAGVDVCLVLVAALCVAEVKHIWKE